MVDQVPTTPIAPPKAPATSTTWARTTGVVGASVGLSQLLQPQIQQFNNLAIKIWPIWGESFESVTAKVNFEWSWATIIAGLVAGLISYVFRGKVGLLEQIRGDSNA